MASIQTTATRVIVEPIQPELTTEIEYGPFDAVPYDEVLLTHDKLRQVGFYALTSGLDWNCNLFLKHMIADVETAWDMTSFTDITCTYWDPITRATTYTLSAVKQSPASTGLIRLTSQSTATVVAGMYDFELTATIATNVPALLCKGKLEIRQAQPS